MDSKTRTLAQVIAVAFFVVVGIGVYAYTLHSDLEATRHSITAVEKDRNSWKSQFDEAQAKGVSATASLEQCTAQVQDLQSQIEASVPVQAPAGKRS